MYEANLKAAAEAPLTPVNDALNDLGHSQSITEGLLEQLTERLGSVLEPTIPSTAVSGPQPCAPPDRSELHGAICGAGCRQARYNDQLRALIDRLTV